MLKRGIIGLALLLTGLTAVGVRRYWLSHIAVCPVLEDAVAQSGEFRNVKFTVAVTYLYNVELRFPAELHPDAVNCLLGLGRRLSEGVSGHKCETGTSNLIVKSSVYRDGVLLQEQLSSPTCRLRDGIVCGVLSFQGSARHAYRVAIEIVDDASGLALVHPKLTVCPTGEFADDWGMYLWVEILGFLAAAVGILFLISLLIKPDRELSKLG